MLIITAVIPLFCALSTLVQATSHHRQHQNGVLDKRARTITETQTETVTETETITETLNCEPTGATTTKGTNTPTATNDVSTIGKCYLVKNVGTFAIKKTYDFTSGQLSPDLQISNYNVPDRAAGNPWNHGFKTSNVYFSDGFLNLRVPGGQNPSKDSKKAIYGGEIYTTEGNILYGSIRTTAIFDDTPGTCQGIFSYHDDTDEIDIEYMGNSSSTANPSPDQPPVLWYTNQPGGRNDNQVTGSAPADVASGVHEYRIDWAPDWTKFFIDGVLQKTLKGNVPRVGSQWVWNNWSNGSPYWSTGPPTDDNIFKIQKIVMYYNTTNVISC